MRLNLRDSFTKAREAGIGLNRRGTRIRQSYPHVLDASSSGGLLGLGVGINALGTIFNIASAIKSYENAKMMQPLKVSRTPDVETPYTGVTSQERAAGQSLLDTAYATTTKTGSLLGRDLSAVAGAQRIEGGRQLGAQYSQINRQAAELETNVELQNMQKNMRENQLQDYYNFQTEAMKAGIQTQALHTIPQSILDFGQGVVSLGNVRTSYEMMESTRLENELNDMYIALSNAYSSNPQNIPLLLDRIDEIEGQLKKS